MKKITGIVEGFFSRPLPIWSGNERKETISFLSKSKSINYYLYCPKQDPYVVEKWDQPYPQKDLKSIIQTISQCKKSNITFCYGFNPAFESPGIKIDYNLYLTKIYQKIDQLLKSGCQDIAILYDDIPQLYFLEDEKKIQQEEVVANMLVDIANTVYQEYRSSLNRFIFCFYDYYFKKESILTSTIKKELNPEIFIIWTGGNRFVKKVSFADLKKTKSLLGNDKKIILWSNYPSNNCEHNIGVFNLDPFNNPDLAVYKNISGLLINPMRESYANIPVFESFIMYLKNPAAYKKTVYFSIYKRLFGPNWQGFYYFFQQFGYPNITSEGKFLVNYVKKAKSINNIVRIYAYYVSNLKKELMLIEAGSSKMSTNGQRFLCTVSPLILGGEAYIAICQQILSKRKIDYNTFILADNFPEFTKRASYLSEILAIINKRINSYDQYVGKKIRSLQKEVFAKPAYYVKKYQGYRKLLITKADGDEIIRIIDQLVSFERKLFVNHVLSSSTLSSRKKILQLSARKNITRYSIVF